MLEWIEGGGVGRLFKDDWAKLGASVATCQLAGTAGAFFSAPSIPTWYAQLAKPEFTPPAWAFAPVWTALYLMMGIGLYLAWKRIEKPGAGRALELFAIQLALNVLWAAAFFGLQSPVAGLAAIVLLWFAIVLTAAAFWQLDERAGALLMPYLAWVSFAAYLNYAIWQLNG